MESIEALSLKQLRALNNKISARIREIEAAEAAAQLKSRLVAFDPGFSVTATEKKRFTGGFFTKQFASGRTKGLYARTAKGILYQAKVGYGANIWEKV